VQTIVFDYDESLLAPGEEPLLRIAHFTNGAWEYPDQVLDIDGNQITVTVNGFSPFALTTVPVPPALAFMLPALGIIAARRNRGHS